MTKLPIVNKIKFYYATNCKYCSTMGVGRQSRRVCFGAKPNKGFLDKKISLYPEVVRGCERELTTRPRERQLVVGQERGELVAGEQRGSCGWRERRELQLDRREANSRSWRGSTEGQSTPDTEQCPRGVVVKAMNCGIVVREFVLQSRYYVHFRANTLGKGMNPLILPPAMDK